MKLVKTANGKSKLNMSYKEWVKIGNKSGWLNKKSGLVKENRSIFDSPNGIEERGNPSDSAPIHYQGMRGKSDVWSNDYTEVKCNESDYNIKWTEKPELVTCKECLRRMNPEDYKKDKVSIPKATCPNCGEKISCPNCGE